jgi:hypothetical protein
VYDFKTESCLNQLMIQTRFGFEVVHTLEKE